MSNTFFARFVSKSDQRRQNLVSHMSGELESVSLSTTDDAMAFTKHRRNKMKYLSDCTFMHLCSDLWKLLSEPNGSNCHNRKKVSRPNAYWYRHSLALPTAFLMTRPSDLAI